MKPQRGVRFWLPRLGFVLAVVLVSELAAKEMPREQTLVFRSETRLTELSAELTRVGETDPRRGFRLQFGADGATSARHPLRLPNGSYLLTLTAVGSGSTPQKTSFSHRVTLEGDPVNVFVRFAP